MIRKINFLPAALLLAFSGSANASLLSTLASSDATLYDLDGDGTFVAGGFDDTFVRPFGSGPSRGVWEFDLSGVSAGAKINSASVLFRDRGTTVPGEMLLYGFAGDGNAGNADGNLTASQIGAFTLGGGSSDLDYNVALDPSVVQQLVDNAASFLGILMVSSSETAGGPGADLCSLFYNVTFGNNACNGAQLTLDFTPSTMPAVPLPAAAWLFGSALVAMFGYGRLRRTG